MKTHKKPSNTLEQVRQMCRKAILKCEENLEIAISAKEIACRVARRLDMKRKSPALTTLCAIEGIAQIARQVLHGRYHPSSLEEMSQMTIPELEGFASKMCDRYAVKRDGAHVYVNPMQTTNEEMADQILPFFRAVHKNSGIHLALLEEFHERRTNSSIAA